MNRHQKRAARKRLVRAGYYKEHNGLTHASLTGGAYDLLVNILERYGNTLSKEHAKALMALVGLMTKMAQGELTGRWAFGLPTGMGKTCGVIAWITTLHRLGLHHVSVAVSASRVEALCQLKRDLIAEGVPESSIGLVHSYQHGAIHKGFAEPPEGYASLPSTGDNDDRQIMLVTHARVRQGASLDAFNTYRGKPRDLLIYDESLLVSDSTGLSVRDLKGALGYLSGKFGDSAKYDSVIAYFASCLGVIHDELARQKDTGRGDGLIKLPTIADEQATEYRSVIGRQAILDPLVQLLELAPYELRAVATGQGGVVHYRVSVPPELRNILVLDASYPIRSLVQIDPTIKDAEKHLPEVKRIGVPLSQLKRFDDVTIHQMFSGGGRDTMERGFSKRSEERKITHEVAEVIARVPENEAVLVFVFKQRPGERTNFREVLLGDLKASGIDTTATIEVVENGKIVSKPRVSVITWGMETSLNCYAYCQHVILVGVLQRSPVDLTGAYLGQTDNLVGEVGNTEVAKLARSEVCHVIYQALSRGSCRVMSNGKAARMTAHFIHRDATIRKALERVMPGAVWRTWEPKHHGKEAGVIARTATKIADYLNGLPKSVTSVSSKELKKVVGLETVGETSFRTARTLAFELSPTPWDMEGRSFVRV